MRWYYYELFKTDRKDKLERLALAPDRLLIKIQLGVIPQEELKKYTVIKWNTNRSPTPARWSKIWAYRADKYIKKAMR